MTTFILYFRLGFRHIWDIQNVGYILFIMALFALFLMRDWRKALLLYAFYAVGHSISIYLSMYKVFNVNMDVITYLIPLTMFITAASNIFKKPGSYIPNTPTKYFLAFVFGIIHGFGFANYLISILNINIVKLIPIIGFNLGIEMGYILVMFTFLFISWIFVNNLNVSRRDWYLIISSGIAGIALTIMFESRYWLD